MDAFNNYNLLNKNYNLFTGGGTCSDLLRRLYTFCHLRYVATTVTLKSESRDLRATATTRYENIRKSEKGVADNGDSEENEMKRKVVY